jgi:integrase
MGRPRKELFTRDGIYYARFRRDGGKKDMWSTGTADPVEAARRLELMRYHDRPYKEIPVMKTAGIDSLNSVYRKNAEEEKRVKDLEAALKEKEAAEVRAIKKAVHDTDIGKLLDEEFELKKQAKKPEGTLKWYRARFAFLKQYVKALKLDLTTFDQKAALGYVEWRMGAVAMKDQKSKAGSKYKHALGYNGKPAGPATINQEIMMFRNAWRLWQGEGKIEANPWVRIKHIPESGKAEEIASKPYTLEEVRKIFNKIEDETMKNVLVLQMALGTRPGEETLAITQEMIDAGKIWSHKKKRWDDFDYSDDIKKFWADNIKGKVKGIEAKHVREAFREGCKLAEVRIGTPYDLRHVYGTEALKKYKIETVSKLLRHSEIRTTQIYSKIRSEEAKEAREAMQGQILGKVTGPEDVGVPVTGG